MAIICPIFKTGDPSIVSNYRPIFVQCNFAKAFETLLWDDILLDVKNSITRFQHIFMEKRSALSNLRLTDFSEAFDRIDHQILLKKLILFNINHSIILLILSFPS